jgi:DNA-binding transcriptional regulator YiaG
MVSDETVVTPEDIRAVRHQVGYSQAESGALFRVSQPAVAAWERGTKKPQGRHVKRLAELVREHLRDGVPLFTAANLVTLRRQLNETQRDFGSHFDVSRQTIANWESGTRKPHPSYVKVFAKLATTIKSRADGPTTIRKTDLFTVAQSAVYLHVAEKTIRNAIKDGRLAYVRDAMPGPCPNDWRYQMTRADLDAFKIGGYDPYFKKGRSLRWNREQEPVAAVLAFPGPELDDPKAHQT